MASRIVHRAEWYVSAVDSASFIEESCKPMCFFHTSVSPGVDTGFKSESMKG